MRHLGRTSLQIATSRMAEQAWILCTSLLPALRKSSFQAGTGRSRVKIRYCYPIFLRIRKAVRIDERIIRIDGVQRDRFYVRCLDTQLESNNFGADVSDRVLKVMDFDKAVSSFKEGSSRCVIAVGGVDEMALMWSNVEVINEED